MYTQCPHCDTRFRVTSDQLKTAQGEVRCGHCDATFNALERLTDDLPPEPAPEPEAATPTAEAPAATPPATLPAQTHLITELEQAVATASPWRHALWTAAALVLILLLGFQYVYFNRIALANTESGRPWVEGICGLVGCEVPLRRAAEQIKLVQRDIRTHPRFANALRVRATLMNEAAFAQPYPQIQLTFHDINDTVLASRRFQPKEYLPADTDIGHGIAAKTSVEIQLELVDPGREAVGFEFEFR